MNIWISILLSIGLLSGCASSSDYERLFTEKERKEIETVHLQIKENEIKEKEEELKEKRRIQSINKKLAIATIQRPPDSMEVLIGKIMQVYSLEKEQFEKNDAFQERKHQLFQELMNDKLYSVEMQFVTTKYDADLELWKAEIARFHEGGSSMEGLEQFPRIEVRTEMKRLIDDTYIGHNAMGVEVKVKRTYSESFGFLVFLQEYQSILRAGIEKGEDDSNYFENKYYYLKIPMPVEIAKNYKGSSPFQYRAVFKLMDNISNKGDILIENIFSTSPTFSSPYESLGKSLYMRVRPIALIAHDSEKKLVHYLPFVNE